MVLNIICFSPADCTLWNAMPIFVICAVFWVISDWIDGSLLLLFIFRLRTTCEQSTSFTRVPTLMASGTPTSWSSESGWVLLCSIMHQVDSTRPIIEKPKHCLSKHLRFIIYSSVVLLQWCWCLTGELDRECTRRLQSIPFWEHRSWEISGHALRRKL